MKSGLADALSDRDRHNRRMVSTRPNQTARRLFSPIAASYEKWAFFLSLGQDRRWREVMVRSLGLAAGSRVLDVAAGTGSISRLLEGQGHQVFAVDLSPPMLAHHRGARRVQARGEQLPFPDQSFDAVTFGHLLRYVTDPGVCLRELVRVLRPGGALGMVEFGLPRGIWAGPWHLYTGVVLPAAGGLIDPGWAEVGAFLRPSIAEFHHRYPDLPALWRSAGLDQVRSRPLSLGGGLVMWGRKR
jgi:demethylmenaquinone methyltransferase/2-methoxy-6-polyprenyl-1,4-benzoquinol methylase